jgi:hypothetical protein
MFWNARKILLYHHLFKNAYIKFSEICFPEMFKSLIAYLKIVEIGSNLDAWTTLQHVRCHATNSQDFNKK